MDNFKLEQKFKEVKNDLEKELIKPDTIIDLALFAVAGMKGLDYQDRAGYCMMLQELIEGYKKEGVIKTGNEYHSFLATLANRAYIARYTAKQLGMDNDDILPEVFIKSTSKFKEMYGAKELPPHPPAPVTQTFNIDRYNDYSIKAPGSNINGPLIGGAGNQITDSFNKNEVAKSNWWAKALSNWWWFLIAPIIAGVVVYLIQKTVLNG